MGEVFDALKAMNRTLKLGLSGPALLRAEMAFKTQIAQEASRHPDKEVPGDPVALAEDYELFVTLKRRPKKLSLSELAHMAAQGVAKDEAFQEIDEALKNQGGSKSNKT